MQVEFIYMQAEMVKYAQGKERVLGPSQGSYSCLHAQIFNNLEVPFTAVNILEDERLRSGMKEYSQWPTFPQAGTLN